MYDEILDELISHLEDEDVKLEYSKLEKIAYTIAEELEEVMQNKIEQYQKYLD